MVRLLVASVVLVCALCQSAFGALLRGEAKGVALVTAPSLNNIVAGTEVTLTFALETEYPYRPDYTEMFLFQSPTSSDGVSSVFLSLGHDGFYAGDGIGADMRARFFIRAPGVYDDPSVVLTPSMMPNATFIYSYLGRSTNYQMTDFTIIQDVPITWHYVPEPASFALALLALGVLLLRVRRK